MLILISSDKLNFEFTLSQPQGETLEGLRQAFINKEGEETYAKASKIIVVENHFHNIIKDRYGPPLIGEHNDNLEEVIFSHLNV